MQCMHAPPTHAAHSPARRAGETLPVSKDFTAYTLREPIGVAGQIIPWCAVGTVGDVANDVANYMYTDELYCEHPASMVSCDIFGSFSPRAERQRSAGAHLPGCYASHMRDKGMER